MSLMRDIELLSARVRSLQNQVNQNKAIIRGNQSAVYQHWLVKAEEDIQPDKTGVCVAMYRRGGLTGGGLELKERPTQKFRVYNHRKTPIWEGEEFNIARDVWNDWYRLSESDRGGIVSFFLTPDTGLPPAPNKFVPYLATPCERHYFDFRAKEIRPVIDEQTGEPLFEPVYNHTENEVGGDLLIQAKKIDGYWFIDVEPCPAEDG